MRFFVTILAMCVVFSSTYAYKVEKKGDFILISEAKIVADSPSDSILIRISSIISFAAIGDNGAIITLSEHNADGSPVKIVILVNDGESQAFQAEVTKLITKKSLW